MGRSAVPAVARGHAADRCAGMIPGTGGAGPRHAARRTRAIAHGCPPTSPWRVSAPGQRRRRHGPRPCTDDAQRSPTLPGLATSAQLTQFTPGQDQEADATSVAAASQLPVLRPRRPPRPGADGARPWRGGRSWRCGTVADAATTPAVTNTDSPRQPAQPYRCRAASPVPTAWVAAAAMETADAVGLAIKCNLHIYGFRAIVCNKHLSGPARSGDG